MTFLFVMLAALRFGLFAGLYFWFPKMFGRTLSERIGKWHFWPWFVGFMLTFLPQFQLGLDGVPRRIADYRVYSLGGWTTLNRLSSVGAAMLGGAPEPHHLAVRPRPGPHHGHHRADLRVLAAASSCPGPPTAAAGKGGSLRPPGLPAPAADPGPEVHP